MQGRERKSWLSLMDINRVDKMLRKLGTYVYIIYFLHRDS